MRAKEHYLPAAYLGRFSVDRRERVRENLLWVRRRGHLVFQQQAQNLAYERGMYDVDLGPTVQSVDMAWEAAERSYGPAVSSLLYDEWRGLAADDFVTLVDFVASLLVRGPEVGVRFPARVAPFMGGRSVSKHHVNGARIFERQRLLYPVMAARWQFLHSPDPLITSDTAMTQTLDARTGEGGYTIPLDPHLAVLITRTEEPMEMAWDGDEWRLPDVPRHVMSPQHTASLNEAVARTAMSEFYGGARQVVEELMPDESVACRSVELRC